MATSASLAPSCVCTAGDDHTGTPLATVAIMSASKACCAPGTTPGAESCPGLMRTITPS